MNKKRLVSSIGIIVLICLIFAGPFLWQSEYWTHTLILTLFSILLAVSLRALIRTGQASLGTAGFMLLGAYSSALMTLKIGLSFWITVPLGGLLAAFVALVIGFPFLRTKGIYFAILTVMMAEALRLTAWYWSDMTGGSVGLRDIPLPNPINIFGIFNLTFDSKVAYYYLVLVIIIVSLVILYRLERSWLGRIWSAISDADNLAEAVGINIMRHKLFIFAVSSFFIGIAGALYAHYMGTLTVYGYPGTPFGFSASIYILIYVVIGGEAKFIGPIIGAVIFTIIPELARGAKEYLPLVFGSVLILVILFMPDGIVGLSAPLSRFFSKVGNFRIKKTQEV